MAVIGLVGGFTVLPEGEYVFQITSVDYKEKFGKLSIVLKTADGQSQTENYTLLGNGGKPNEGAYRAFSFLARAAMGDSSIQEVDPQHLIGKFIKGRIEHESKPSTNNPGQMVTFSHLRDSKHADGWGESPAPADEYEEVATEDIDLASLLG